MTCLFLPESQESLNIYQYIFVAAYQIFILVTTMGLAHKYHLIWDMEETLI